MCKLDYHKKVVKRGYIAMLAVYFTYRKLKIGSTLVRKAIETVRKQRTRQYMRLVIVRQRDKLDILFRHYLCEDRAGQGTSASGSDSNFSYVDFLCHMHKEIRALLG